MNAHAEIVTRWRERAYEELSNAEWAAQAISDCFDLSDIEADRIAENERLRQRCDARADLLLGANGSPESMLEQAMLRDGYDDDVIERVKENERLRRAVDAILGRIDGECGWSSCEHADHQADIETLRSAIKGDG